MSHAPAAALEHRHRTVREAFERADVGALIVTARSNIVYLTNFVGSAAIVVLTRDRLQFMTDSRYVTALETLQRSEYACPDLELVKVEGSYDTTLVKHLQSLGLARIGVEAGHMNLSRYNWLTATLAAAMTTPPQLVPTEGLVERARRRKDAYELSTLRTAAEMLSAVALGVFDEVRRGRSERDIALGIDVRLRRAGFERPAFDTIVAGGPHSALPHAQPGERILSEGDLVVLDFGGVYDSYCVDLTRTVSVGQAGQRARDVHAAVREAHDRAIAVVAPHRSRFAIDAAARDALASRGLAEAFGHGTGHGLGLDVHEEPRISRRVSDKDEDEPVEEGMIFTIEPGAYLPGWGGVRIEDDVLVTDAGVEVLTKVTAELLEL
jgi:Xaa-Pro aminopeptidase